MRNTRMRRAGVLVLMTMGIALACSPSAPGTKSGPRFSVSFPSELSSTPLDGRMLLMISKNPEGEPRNQISDSVNTQQVFGIDVEGLKPGEGATFDASVLGYPVESLAGVQAGTYTVQALLHVYETFKR